MKPSFPKFDKNDVFMLSDNTAVYSGYYKFALTKNDATKEVYAKFSYIVRKTPEYGVKIVTHNSGITPTGAVAEDSKISMEDVETCIGTYAWGCAEVHGNVEAYGRFHCSCEYRGVNGATAFASGNAHLMPASL